MIIMLFKEQVIKHFKDFFTEHNCYTSQLKDSFHVKIPKYMTCTIDYIDPKLKYNVTFKWITSFIFSYNYESNPALINCVYLNDDIMLEYDFSKVVKDDVEEWFGSISHENFYYWFNETDFDICLRYNDQLYWLNYNEE